MAKTGTVTTHQISQMSVGSKSKQDRLNSNDYIVWLLKT